MLTVEPNIYIYHISSKERPPPEEYPPANRNSGKVVYQNAVIPNETKNIGV